MVTSYLDRSEMYAWRLCNVPGPLSLLPLKTDIQNRIPSPPPHTLRRGPLLISERGSSACCEHRRKWTPRHSRVVRVRRHRCPLSPPRAASQLLPPPLQRPQFLLFVVYRCNSLHNQHHSPRAQHLPARHHGLSQKAIANTMTSPTLLFCMCLRTARVHTSIDRVVHHQLSLEGRQVRSSSQPSDTRAGQQGLGQLYHHHRIERHFGIH